MKYKSDRQGGFTIIEVVLVLAVAGLIFLVVFAAIPRLQASRRDNQRKRDAEAIWALAIDYEANAGTVLLNSQMDTAFPDNPVTTPPSGVFLDYIDDTEFKEPSRGFYIHNDVSAASLAAGEFRYLSGFYCTVDGLHFTSTNATANDIAIMMGLERGRYCIDSR